MKKNLPVTGVEQTFSDQTNILSTTNLKGQITYINDDFVAISGFTREELIGQNHHIVRHPDMPSPVFKMFWNDLKADRSWMGIVKNRCKNGDHYWVDAYATPIKKEGNIQEYQSVRRSAKPEFVARATAVYQRINQGQQHPKTRSALALWKKVALACVTPALLPLAAWLISDSLSVIFSAALASSMTATAAVLYLLKPLSLAVAASRKLSDDHVARFVYTGRADEVGSILLAFKKLESENAALIGRLNDMSNALSQSTESLSSAVVQSEAGTRQQFEQTEYVSTAVSQMTASIQNVAHNAHETSNASLEGHKIAEQGKQIVNDNSLSVTALKDQIVEAARIIDEVSLSSINIEKILDVITSIAEQTNLLALNAAIEAARAGETGRGFAVVADEVRSLATRTQESTEQIRAVIEGLQKGVSGAVSAMKQGEDMANESVQKSEQTAENLNQIVTAITHMSSMSQQIAESVKEQSTVAEKISSNINSIRVSAEQNLEAVKLSNDVSDTTVAITRRLEQLTTQFWTSQQVQ